MSYTITPVKSEEDIAKLRRGSVVTFNLDSYCKGYLDPSLGPAIVLDVHKDRFEFGGELPQKVLGSAAVFKISLVRRALLPSEDGRIVLQGADDTEFQFAGPSRGEHNRLYHRIKTELEKARNP